MSAQNSGGPAFPSLELDRISGQVVDQHFGVSLRDYFADKAPITVMDAMIACGYDTASVGTLTFGHRVVVMKMLASMRSEYADAMLAERTKPATQPAGAPP